MEITLRIDNVERGEGPFYAMWHQWVNATHKIAADNLWQEWVDL